MCTGRPAGLRPHAVRSTTERRGGPRRAARRSGRVGSSWPPTPGDGGAPRPHRCRPAGAPGRRRPDGRRRGRRRPDGRPAGRHGGRSRWRLGDHGDPSAAGRAGLRRRPRLDGPAPPPWVHRHTPDPAGRPRHGTRSWWRAVPGAALAPDCGTSRRRGDPDRRGHGGGGGAPLCGRHSLVRLGRRDGGGAGEWLEAGLVGGDQRYSRNTTWRRTSGSYFFSSSRSRVFTLFFRVPSSVNPVPAVDCGA